MPALTPRRRLLVLATVCLAAFAINLDTTIVNVALPELSRELDATTRELQWVVDGYNLAFAALVLTAGSLGDRFGRRPALLWGLGGFAATSALGSVAGSPGGLVAVRFAMGACAATIFPTTLSIITNTFPDRRSRAKAVGVWGAVTGLGVAVGPVAGGLLLAHFGWPSVFLALVPVALLALAATWAWVPESNDPSSARLDPPGLAASSAAVGILVYTIIEAPERGWGAPVTIAGFVLAVVLGAVFVRIERGRAHPMIDMTLFRTPAFSAASGSVTLAFFALFGFIFLVTQYFQFVRGYGALSTGVRVLPVALTIAAGSLGGVALVARLGTRAVVTGGLVLLGTSFAWIATSPTFVPYDRIVGQMVLLGLGLGLTTAPATESILSVLPPAKAGVGSAVNDATREAGGTLGVAVLGSVFTSVFAGRLADTSFADLPPRTAAAAEESVASALGTAARLQRADLLTAVQSSFMDAFHLACLVAAGVALLGAVGARLALPGRIARPPGGAAGRPLPSAPGAERAGRAAIPATGGGGDTVAPAAAAASTADRPPGAAGAAPADRPPVPTVMSRRHGLR
ncbi:MFS transporter [Kitasatospora indigofera]|uniref:MFS transporter n=1 Tax=Kitasatospora indigofera TaxID=67307 RepID=A0A919FB39_9ACTN|nr:MFS transporter [Kitasatospora indigofera]GHH58956.1 MFS transporter [Kitasatospora indigofera]